mmetsp:Transcript_15787/g.19252  ORF Transcript_15787/g.19252 Transcript_15787/m.19252 type:complete len:190 (+) Transcript_15787:84-653(+)
MPPATRTMRRSTRSRRASPLPSNDDFDGKNFTQSAGESILRSSGSDGDENNQSSQLKQKKVSSSVSKNNRSVTFSLDNQSPPSPSISDASSSIKGRGVSARAQRSMRRQAKIETDPSKKSSMIKKGYNKRQMEYNIKKEFNKLVASDTTTIMKKGAGGKEEEVVKVKLNTGTLYLYKGLHRRAIFNRRV